MKTLYVTDRTDWRSWLEKNHGSEKEIWLVYYRKHTGKPRISYEDAVEEALAFGWIDSIQKGIDDERFAQRFTPRNDNSNWSEANKERARRLIREGRMTPFGMAKIAGMLKDKGASPKKDILTALKKDKTVWDNYNKFPGTYKTVRIGWIEGARNRPEVFQKRLNYFLKMTGKNKMFGIVR
ncbi:MAG: YdeI/OmpD-associated family protein [Candidatus Altiarchaeia archaeon]